MSTTQLFQKVFHPLLGLAGTTIPHSYRVGTYMYKNNNFGQERGMGTGLGTILQHLLKRLKFSALECKRTWQSTIPETLAKVYVAWRMPTYSTMYQYQCNVLAHIQRNVLEQCISPHLAKCISTMYQHGVLSQCISISAMYQPMYSSMYQYNVLAHVQCNVLAQCNSPRIEQCISTMYQHSVLAHIQRNVLAQCISSMRNANST